MFAGSEAGHNDHQWWKGQCAFASFLIHYFENLDLFDHEKYDFWRIEPYLPELMVDAFEQLRTGTDEITVKFRKEYEEETGHEVPNIIDLGASNLLEQVSAVQTTLGFMLKEVTGQDWVEHEIDKYCNAQRHVLQQTFGKFVRLVYRRGMFSIVSKSEIRGTGGKFGDTELRTFVTAGRIMFTFARRIDKNKPSHYAKGDGVICNEDSVSFVASEDNPLCLEAGLLSVHADFRTALDMIEDVIKHWPSDEKEQQTLFASNDKIGIF